mmetsp:Transcript_20736/g.35381  ORF Transcript_20736/g.35381 Transcript_20736/m.35381 type:complete len:243 (+) Transcript_20736:916-1644(+)
MSVFSTRRIEFFVRNSEINEFRGVIVFAIIQMMHWREHLSQLLMNTHQTIMSTKLFQTSVGLIVLFAHGRNSKVSGCQRRALFKLIIVENIRVRMRSLNEINAVHVQLHWFVVAINIHSVSVDKRSESGHIGHFVFKRITFDVVDCFLANISPLRDIRHQWQNLRFWFFITNTTSKAVFDRWSSDVCCETNFLIQFWNNFKSQFFIITIQISILTTIVIDTLHIGNFISPSSNRNVNVEIRS